LVGDRLHVNRDARRKRALAQTELYLVKGLGDVDGTGGTPDLGEIGLVGGFEKVLDYDRSEVPGSTKQERWMICWKKFPITRGSNRSPKAPNLRSAEPKPYASCSKSENKIRLVIDEFGLQPIDL
jgi:hypothetical protein